ncbi:hypothetical protein VNI00_011122 [Paramarasmius palmivorus]|uniref:Uncharacterized protein n=1 Tax=Paramarasmius palmivorus TaxID=297713 RepID=A0AAW0CEQ6_9AGAR
MDREYLARPYFVHSEAELAVREHSCFEPLGTRVVVLRGLSAGPPSGGAGTQSQDHLSSPPPGPLVFVFGVDGPVPAEPLSEESETVSGEDPSSGVAVTQLASCDGVVLAATDEDESVTDYSMSNISSE